jgi:hypothetical protein
LFQGIHLVLNLRESTEDLLVAVLLRIGLLHRRTLARRPEA